MATLALNMDREKILFGLEKIHNVLLLSLRDVEYHPTTNSIEELVDLLNSTLSKNQNCFIKSHVTSL